MPPSDQPAIPKRLISADGTVRRYSTAASTSSASACNRAINTEPTSRPTASLQVGPAVAAPLRHQHGITGGDVEAGELQPGDGPPLKPGARPVVVDEGRERAGPGGLIEIALNAQPAALIADLAVRLLRTRRVRCQQRHKPGGRNAGDDVAAARHFAQDL